MPFQRSVNTGGSSAFEINKVDADGIAINATATTGTGIRGQSLTNGDGVRGLSANGHGLHGVGFVGGWFQGENMGIRVHGAGSNEATGIVDISDLNTFASGNLIIGRAADASHRFRVDARGKVFANGGYSTGGADVAEFVPASEAVEPGDVVEIDTLQGNTLRHSSRANSTAVAGVVSTRPGLTLNGSMSEEEARKGMPRLALSGRVPVKVTAENGVIHAGDLLVSSSRPGHAMRAPESPRAGTVIGKAMHSLDGDSGQIEMLVMLR
jgi:hypothetical protein